MTSRAEWLRDPSRPRRKSSVDPRPVEASVLDRRADTMREMVQQQVRGMVAASDTSPDEEWDDDEDFEEWDDVPAYTHYQLAHVLAEEHLAKLAEQSEGDEVAEVAAQAAPSESENNPDSTQA